MLPKVPADLVAGTDGDPVADGRAARAGDAFAEDPHPASKDAPAHEGIARCGKGKLGRTEGEVHCAVHHLEPKAPIPDVPLSRNTTYSTDVDKPVRLSPYLCYCFFSYTSSCANPNLTQHAKPGFPPSPVSYHTALWVCSVLEHLAKSPEGAAL